MSLYALHQQPENTESERVDPRIARTRQLLEDAFMDLLRKEKFETITVREITERAGVNRATFYAHFEDKYALFAYSIQRGFNQIVQTRLPQNTTLTKENLIQLILALRDFFTMGNAQGCKNAQHQPIRPLIESRVQEQIANLLRTWLQASDGLQIRSEPEITAMLLSWSIFGYAHKLTESQVDHHEIGKAVDIILYGVIEGDTTSQIKPSHNKAISLSGFANVPQKHAKQPSPSLS